MKNIKSLREISKNFKLLYVEDDAEIQSSLEDYLSKLFLEVGVASNGEEGLALYKSENFDLVITDLSMPVMDGIQMIEAIKKENEEQVILITTAHTESKYMLSAIKEGVDGYIVKPFDFAQLNQELLKAVQKVQICQENELYKLHLNAMVESQTSELTSLLEYQNKNYEKTLSSMIEMVEARDTYTAGHSKRVAHYAQIIAQEMGYSKEDTTLIYQAGILHDVGKIGTPDAVLLNPKPLNTLEYKLIQDHVRVSYKLLRSIPMFESLAEIVYSHHERYDGKGYPRSLKAEEICPLGRILIVADAFDAMTTSRIYKARRTVEEAIKELTLLSGLQFDPEVVKSAVVVLKDVRIDKDINQLPQSKLEEEKFAYFYKDTLSNAYNQNYLDVVLMKNEQDHFFNEMILISLKKFTLYNKENSWQRGDELLKEIAGILLKSVENSYVFRIFGDDFVILSEHKQEIEKLKIAIDKVVSRSQLEYSMECINLLQEKVQKVAHIEKLQVVV